jgi:hypothetical protein
MAIFGWDTIKEAEKYTAKAGQRRLAESAMHLLDVRYTLRGLLAEQIRYLGKWWCPGAELNHRHLHFQCSALPTELPGHSLAGRQTRPARAPWL